MELDLTTLEHILRTRTPGLMDSKRSYAVLVPLVEREGELQLLYEVRARTLRRQPGEVCFPGGRMEPGETAEECALRETFEELAIPPERVRLLGRLDFIAHRASFLMQPVLGVVDSGALEAMRPGPAEVEEVFFVPLSHLLETESIEYDYDLVPTPADGFPYELIGIPRDYKWQLGHENVPVYLWQGRAIWGLTGRITRNLIRICKAPG
ncbi:CoA pyrophosphatase [Colidextribacter sp. OB.20]|uniref:NUDIX hydrolase n=1 Tax=Colidextribacter sp. OB.20 TaxID=2304568 RepID=UPI0013683886|nr:CoA pyrophosphatase [Colidextribacter sp. OB.20]NBI08845.1 CoA pyrophosphatase [Colidextribacter sp. OB.20]